MKNLKFVQSLLVDSRNRRTGNPLNNFHIDTQINVSNVDCFAIDRVFMTNNIYPVNQYTHSLQTVYDNSGVVETLNITLAHGSYTITALCSAVQTALNFASNALGYTTTYTCSFSNTTQKVTITGTSTPAGTLETVTGTLAPLLGFNNTTIGISNSLVGSDPVNIVYTRYLNICSQFLSKYNKPNVKTDAQTPGIIYTLNNNYYAFGSSIKENVRNLRHTQWSGDETINNFDIQVYDDSNRLADMNNSEFQFVINFYKYE